MDNLDDYPYWQRKTINGLLIPTTSTFGPGYNNLEYKYKKFFEELSKDNSAEPLMIGKCLNRFRLVPNNAPINKYYDIIYV